MASPTITTAAGAGVHIAQLGASASVEQHPKQGSHGVEAGKKTSAYIRYRTEYRDRNLGDLLFRKDTTGIQSASDDSSASDDPVFEVITTIKAKVKDTEASKVSEPQQIASTFSKPQYHMNIYSSAVINALQSVVEYYPSQSLVGDPIRVDYPYCVLAHHYDELSAFREAAKCKNAVDLCHLEKNVVEHLDLVLEFLDANIMTKVREERERNSRGCYTWEFAWVGFQPGKTVLKQWRGQRAEWTPHVIHSVAEGSF